MSRGYAADCAQPECAPESLLLMNKRGHILVAVALFGVVFGFLPATASALADVQAIVHSVHIAAVEHREKIVFLHKVKEGAANRSDGIQVAHLAGIPGDCASSKLEALHQLKRTSLV